MIKEKFKNLIASASSLSKRERIFILLAMLCGVCITSEYSIVRPVSNSVFLHFFHASLLAYAWLLAVPVNFVVVALYNRFIGRYGCVKLQWIICGSVISINLLATALLKISPGFAFFYFIWKDIYVLLMFQQVWSVIHSSITAKKAKYLYGLMFGIGGIGGMVGSLLPSLFAVKVGSELLLFASLPLYLALQFFYRKMLDYSDINSQSTVTKSGSFLEGMGLIYNSRYLTYILLIVIFMQVSSTIVEFQFNHFLEKMMPLKDVRTAYLGKVSAIINTCTLALQLLGTLILVQALGIKRSHLTVPLFLLFANITYLLFPLFQVGSVVYVSVKAIDFSVFQIIKEMLYVPLQTHEKFGAKAFIDVFAHRAAKAFASMVILSLQFISVLDFMTLLSGALIVLLVAWSLVLVNMFRTYKVEEQFT